MIDKGIIHSFVGEAKDFLELQNRKISPEAYEKVLALCENLRLERVIRKLIRKSNSKKRSEHDVIRDHFAELLRAEEKKIKESPPAPKYPQYVPPSFLQRCRENIREFWSTLQFSIRVRREYRLDPRPKLEMRHYRFSKVSCTIKDSFYLAEHQRGGLLYLEGELTGPEVVRGEKVILTLNLIGHGPARGLMHFNAMLDPKRPIRASISMPADQATMDLICERLSQDGVSPYIADFLAHKRSVKPPHETRTLGLVFDVWHLGRYWSPPDLVCFIKTMAIADPKKRDIFNKDRLN